MYAIMISTRSLRILLIFSPPFSRRLKMEEQKYYTISNKNNQQKSKNMTKKLQKNYKITNILQELIKQDRLFFRAY